jgi:hypothetical protein
LWLAACGEESKAAPEMEPDMSGSDEEDVVMSDEGEDEDGADPGGEEPAGIEQPGGEVPPLMHGEVPAPWSDFCVARFEKEYVLRDWLDNEVLTARAGDEFLLSSWYSGSFTLAVPGGSGVLLVDAELPFDDEPDAFPFTTKCTRGATGMQIVAFDDVTLFADEALTEEICTLKRGANFAFNSWESGGIDGTLPIGRIAVEGWPAPCAGHSEAFFAQPVEGYPIYHVEVPL